MVTLMSKRLKETGKSLLIVLLMISAMFLASKSELFNNMLDVPAFSGLNRFLSSKNITKSKTIVKTAITGGIRPVCVSVTSKYGDHSGIKYNSDELNAFYNRVSGILGEALSSDAPLEEVSEAKWREALSSPGFFIDYCTSVPLTVLYKSPEANSSSEQKSSKVQRICLAGVDGKVYMYFVGENNSFYRYPTQVTSTALTNSISQYLPNEASFAFELGSTYRNVDPYTVIMKSMSVLNVGAVNPFYGIITRERILEAFGANSLIDSKNPDAFGGEQFSLRFNSDGTLLYKASDTSGGILKIRQSGSSPTYYEMLETTSSLLSSTIGYSCGDKTSVQLTGFNYDPSERSWTLTFDYFVNGVIVKMTSYPHAATIKINGSYITYVSMVFRSYTLGDSSQKILPERQAAALLSAGKAPMLYYTDDGTGALTADWSQR